MTPPSTISFLPNVLPQLFFSFQYHHTVFSSQCPQHALQLFLFTHLFCLPFLISFFYKRLLTPPLPTYLFSFQLYCFSFPLNILAYFHSFAHSLTQWKQMVVGGYEKEGQDPLSYPSHNGSIGLSKL